MKVLAGDVGGTTTRLAFFDAGNGEQSVVVEKHYPSSQYGSLTEIIKLFVEEHPLIPERACFGIAGPVVDGKVKTPNLPWNIERSKLAQVLDLPNVKLINDLDANAYGVRLLKDDDLAVLNQGKANASGSIAVISAGTGLGESIAYWDGSFYRPLPSEGGHADFAPRSALECELLVFLQAEFGRVSYERVVSGPGLFNIYRFYRDVHRIPETPSVVDSMLTSDPAHAITTGALSNNCPICKSALELFISIYGAEAGNAALRFFAVGGIYIGGGIAPHIIEELRGPGFMAAFTAKGRLSPILKLIPVKVILNDRTALIGAGVCASIE